MRLFPRRSRKRTPEGFGVIVKPGHRCCPPGAHEWPAGSWKVDEKWKYPEGTVWRCECGLAWISTAAHSLWLNWERAYKHDLDKGADDE